MRALKNACFALLLVALLANVQALDCLSPTKASIAWWAKLKLPIALKISSHLYYDSLADAAKSKNFELLNHKVDSSGAALYNTLDQLNNIQKSDVHIIAFNDDFPDGRTFSGNAHAKGVIAFNNREKKGFYLMHSVPGFPNITAQGVEMTLPTSGWIYGQHFICVSIDEEGMDSLVEGFKVTRPNVYFDNGSKKPAYSKLNFTQYSIKPRFNGKNFTIISKSPNHKEYFYTEVVAPHFNANLAVVSWNRPTEPPQCNGTYSCVNINRLKFNEKIQWSILQDHSKWLVSYEGSRKFACFSDLNRAASQKKRGGSVMCFADNSNIYYALHNLISHHDQCKPTL